MQQNEILKKLKEFNEENHDIGFNEQEQEAFDNSYFLHYLPAYLPAKLRLLEAMKKAKDD